MSVLSEGIGENDPKSIEQLVFDRHVMAEDV